MPAPKPAASYSYKFIDPSAEDSEKYFKDVVVSPDASVEPDPSQTEAAAKTVGGIVGDFCALGLRMQAMYGDLWRGDRYVRVFVSEDFAMDRGTAALEKTARGISQQLEGCGYKRGGYAAEVQSENNIRIRIGFDYSAVEQLCTMRPK